MLLYVAEELAHKPHITTTICKHLWLLLIFPVVCWTPKTLINVTNVSFDSPLEAQPIYTDVKGGTTKRRHGGSQYVHSQRL